MTNQIEASRNFVVEIDNIIIGGGICGLLLARELQAKYPHEETCILETELYPGEHSSSRNSGVLHAGIYYPTGSLKHQLCVEGNMLWSALSKELEIQINHCGKYVIAASANEMERLEKLYRQAISNKVPGIRKLNADEIKALSAHVHIEDGFLSESTAVIDLSGAIKALEKDLFKKNIPLMLGHQVTEISRSENGFILTAKTKEESFEIRCNKLFNMAGLQAVELRKKLGLNDLELKMVKGNYLKASQNIYKEKLIYPVPEEGLKGLGVHTSFDLEGVVRFGPNTEDISTVDYKTDSKLTQKMYAEIKKIFKGIDPEKLSPDYSGIRPKIIENGELYQDFWIKSPQDLGIEGYFEACGIESPGFTAAPAIAKKIIKLL